MPISYSIDESSQTIFEVWDGEITKEVLSEYWKNYLSNSRVLELRRTTVDMRKAQIVFTGKDLNELIQTIVAPILQGRNWITAIVIDSPVHLGVSRQYQVFSDFYSKDQIFYNCESAMAWLSLQ